MALQDPDVDMVLSFIEAVRRPEDFVAVAQLATEVGKPIVAIKVGRTQEAAARAAAHTGALAGEDRAVEQAGVDPERIDDVILGCVTQMGAQAFNVARTAVLSAGLPESVPGTTIDRQCGSSQQAVHFAAQAVRSGDMDVVIAGGVEVMSLVPMESAAVIGVESGMGDEEIVAWGKDTVDEGPRPGVSLEKIAGLDPLSPGGSFTAAVASQISDGAAALVIASEKAVDRDGLTPLARIHTTAVVGCDPVMMLAGPKPPTQRVLKRSGLALDDIDHFEVNEAFAPIVLAWQEELGAAADLTNPLGGAIALGHPLGATGARLMTTMVHSLRRTGGRYGLQTMREGGGMANATVIVRV